MRLAVVESIALAVFAGCAASEVDREREQATVQALPSELVWEPDVQTVAFSVGHLRADDVAKTLNTLAGARREAVETRGCALGPPGTWPGLVEAGTWFTAAADNSLCMHTPRVDEDEVRAVRGLLVRLGAVEEPSPVASRQTDEVIGWDVDSIHEFARATTFHASACSCCVDLIDLRWPRAEAYATYLNEVVRWRREAVDELQWEYVSGLYDGEVVSPESTFAAQDEFKVVVLSGPTDPDSIAWAYGCLEGLDLRETRRRMPNVDCVLRNPKDEQRWLEVSGQLPEPSND